MRFLYAQLDPQSGEILGVGAHPEPLKWTAPDIVSIGAVDETTLPDGVAPCAYAIARLEKHPAADTHPDAPRIRWCRDVADIPEVHWMPCSLPDLHEHCEARGKDGLPDQSKLILRQVLSHRADIPAKTFAALGYTAAEIKALPRFAEARAAAAKSAMNRQLEAERQAAEAEREAVRQARINRRLNKD
jgi:hypothetical protein